MSFWHSISHFLKINSEFLDTYTRNNQVYSGFRCCVCGRVRNEYHNHALELILAYSKKINNL